MISHQFSSAVLGCALGFAILLLVRRDHLQLSHALFWLSFAAASVVFGVFPSLSDHIGGLLGISYGPALVLVIAISGLILKTLQADIQATQLERKLRRLTQRMALLEAETSSQSTPPKTAPTTSLIDGAQNLAPRNSTAESTRCNTEER